MKCSSARMPLRLRGALLALSLAAMTTQVSGASSGAAADHVAASRDRISVATLAVALPDGRAQLNGLARLSPGPPVSGGWGLLAAGLMGVWAIGRRRLSAPGGRSLDPRRPRGS